MLKPVAVLAKLVPVVFILRQSMHSDTPVIMWYINSTMQGLAQTCPENDSRVLVQLHRLQLCHQLTNHVVHIGYAAIVATCST